MSYQGDFLFAGCSPIADDVFSLIKLQSLLKHTGWFINDQ
jgi:hypothetical protein